jgi:TonB family protein
MKIPYAVRWCAAVWCLVAASVLPAAADEPASCYKTEGFLPSNGSKPGANIDPVYKTHTLVPYPDASQRRREQGISIFSVSIGADGTPTDVALTRSSASQTLNDGAMEYIKAHWRWPSPVTSCGQNSVQVPVTVLWFLIYAASVPNADFHLKMPPSAYPPGAVEKLEVGYPTLLEIQMDAQGEVSSGRVIHSSGYADLDDQALAVVKSSPSPLKGQPAGKLILSADWEMPRGALPSNGETEIRTGREPQ